MPRFSYAENTHNYAEKFVLRLSRMGVATLIRDFQALAENAEPSDVGFYRAMLLQLERMETPRLED